MARSTGLGTTRIVDQATADPRIADPSAGRQPTAGQPTADQSAAGAVTTDVTGANVTAANVTGANVKGTNVTGANVTGSDITGADVTGAEQVVASLDRLYRLLRRIQPDNPLSLTASSTLRRLADSGSCRLTDLAALEGVSQPAMTQLVTRLEKDGLVVRRKDDSDGRVCHVGVTPMGRELLREKRTRTTRRLAQLLTTLDPADRDAILAALPALNKLDEKGPANP
jgi:DNA-binding MarR family transcriptional regulator